MSTKLRQALEQVAQRFRRVRLWSGLALCWLALALIGSLIAFLRSSPVLVGIPPGWLLVTLVSLATVAGLVCTLWALRSARDPRWVARRIEVKHPELAAELLAAVDEVEAAPAGRLSFLQASVVREALEHRRSHDWDQTVPTWMIRGAKLAHAAALALLLVVVVALTAQVRSSAYGGWGFWSRADAAEVQIDPGDTEIERGSTLLVVARFQGTAPPDARLVVEGRANGPLRRAMTRSLEDPTFAGRVESVESDLAYRVEFEGRSTETYHVHVFEYPELNRADAHLIFPKYTALEPKVVEDIRHVTAVEGTELTLLCRLNKDVASATLVDKDGQTVALDRDPSIPHTYRATMTLNDPRRYRLQLVDPEGRTNQVDSEIVVNVTRNQPPTVAISQPSRDVQVSPLEELKLKARLEDDFGLVRHGLTYSLGAAEPKELVLSAPAKTPPAKRLGAEHLLDFEAMKAVPDQLVTYFFWAEDIGPDGKPRRASGDMYFAEVRHFEEIFRQGEQPPAGSAEMDGESGENAQDSDRLVELQKQIINGTWKLVRRETRTQPTAAFAEDSKTLYESQKAVTSQADQLGERLRDRVSKANLEQATRFMKDAEKHLGAATRGPSIPALMPALTAEQAAYQALLKLRAREFQVIRNNARRRGGRAGGSASQRQLQQLELSPDENRYEEQRTARSQDQQSQREREQRENRQVLNRLRELAQRQNDLNERLKELQSALEAAKTPEARAELERQLKRLREQQQEILRDTDELRERMEREENQQRMAEARQQIEQSREHVRQASRALEEGRLPQALTEGTRAGRQLSELREQLRKATSNRFAEEMTEMREQARRLDEDQKRISDQLDAWEQNAEHSLRDSEERKQVRQGAEQQRQRLDQILDRMRNTTQDAEDTEPLLAKGLYDTVRKANEQKVPDALKATQQLVDLGVAEEAAKAARHARQGIEQLRQGVDRAAESVLGDDTAALRRAQAELEDLADQVNREIARATPRDRRQSEANRQGEPNRQGEAPAEPNRQDPRRQPGRGDAQRPQGQPGRQPDQQGRQGEGQAPAESDRQNGSAGGSPSGTPNPDRPARGGLRQARSPQAGGGGERPDPTGLDRVAGGPAGGPHGPITGDGFRQWSDRMRDVEELLVNPEWRAEAARIRDRVRGEREEVRKHAKEPDWTKLQTMVAQPINELRNRIAEEVRRRESPDALVPIDRDPVPPQYAEGVRRYYERLGSGQ